MAWSTVLPLVDLAQRLVDARLRAERLSIAQRIAALETRAGAQGLELPSLAQVKGLLVPMPVAPTEQVDRQLTLPRKPAGVWRRKYLRVQSVTGSVF